MMDSSWIVAGEFGFHAVEVQQRQDESQLLEGGPINDVTGQTGFDALPPPATSSFLSSLSHAGTSSAWELTANSLFILTTPLKLLL